MQELDQAHLQTLYVEREGDNWALTVADEGWLLNCCDGFKNASFDFFNI